MHDVIMFADFGEYWLRGLDMDRGKISGFPIDLRIVDPYNTPAFTVRMCDVVAQQTTG